MNLPLKVSGPPSLLASLPYLLGFTPTNSLICVLLERESITGCVRYEVPADETKLFDQIKQTISNHRFDAMVVVLTADDLAMSVARFLDWFRTENILLLDFLVTNWVAYRSALCQDLACCPITGTKLSEAQRDQVAAELVAAGHVAAPTRADLVAQLQPQVRQIPDEMVARANTITATELIDLLTQIHRTGLEDNLIVQIGNAINDAELRNDLEYQIFSSTNGELINPAQLRIVTENLRRTAIAAPTSLAAMSYGLLSFCYWNLGEWILASESADIALRQDVRNSPARLTKRLISQGIDPVTARDQIFPTAA